MSSNFSKFNISSDILETIDKLGYENPTAVQQEVIPKILDRKDLIVKSQTGSGKTASFAIPVCELVQWDENKPQALVLTPTRELAIQVRDDIFHIGRMKRIKVVPVFGKAPMKSQIRDLKQKCHVVVGTPGRIIDHLDRGTLDVSMVKNLVIDEADEMLNMGFIKDVETIMNLLPNDVVSTLLSATMPEAIETLCKKHLKDPETIEVEHESSTVDRIDQDMYEVHEDDKIDLLFDVTTIENPDSAIVFCNTKQQVDDVDYMLYKMGYTCEKIHGSMEQKERIQVINDFRNGKFRYLVATDVAARGIDIEDVSLIVNYDIPFEKESYVHRIGRTGRKDKTGKAITFVSRGQERFLHEVEDLIGINLTLKYAPSKEYVEEAKDTFWAKMDEKPEVKEQKGAAINEEILKLHINAGKKQKMRPTDIVGTLCNLDGMSAKDIGIISIIDLSTFVEILNNKGEEVLAQLQKIPIKGRLRVVSKANTQL